MGIGLIPPMVHADDYVDDVYYLPAQELTKKQNKPTVPTYDKKVREIVFIQDTTHTVTPDTVVRAVIREKQPQ